MLRNCFIILVCIITQSSFAQLVGGVRFSYTPTFFSYASIDSAYGGSASFCGPTTFLRMEASRIVLEGSFTRYFNKTNDMSQNTYIYLSADEYAIKSLGYKPYAFSTVIGYKIKPSRSIDIFPLLGICRYHLETLQTGSVRNEVVTQRKRETHNGFVMGMGASYSYKRWLLDTQFNYTRVRYFGSTVKMLNFSMGVGYRLGKTLVRKRKGQDYLEKAGA